MTTAVLNERTRERVIDAIGRAAHVAHETRMVKSLAADALDEAVHASKRTIKTARRRIEELADRRHEIARQVRRQPFKAIGFAFGAGMLIGVATGRLCRRAQSRAEQRRSTARAR